MSICGSINGLVEACFFMLPRPKFLNGMLLFRAVEAWKHTFTLRAYACACGSNIKNMLPCFHKQEKR